MTWIELEYGGRLHRVAAVRAAGRLWFHLNGETHVLDLGSTEARSRGGPRQSAEPGVIKAPMPGKVTRVMVRAGQTVARGDALIVMEAMKMEYTLSSDIEGQVASGLVELGAQVSLGQVLVKVGATK